jgi:hypothetical protein
MLFDVTGQTWREWATNVGTVGYMTWSRDSKYVGFDNLLSDDDGYWRVWVADGKVERVAGFKTIRRFWAIWGPWTGLAPDGSPLVVRDISNQRYTHSICNFPRTWHRPSAPDRAAGVIAGQKVYPWAKDSARLLDSNGLYGESISCGHREPLKNAALRANLDFLLQPRLPLVFGSLCSYAASPKTGTSGLGSLALRSAKASSGDRFVNISIVELAES